MFQPIRVAVCGRKNAPPLFETLAVLGRETCLHRIGRDAADQWLQAHFTHLGRRGTVALSQYA